MGSSVARFSSILFHRPDDAAGSRVTEADPFFTDLNLGQVVDSVTRGRDEYDLRPFFCIPLHDAESVSYRHDVMRDLEQEAVLGAVTAFAQRMHQMREQLAQASRLH